MATIASVRQPFGVVDHSRLRNLASTKNKQAALALSSPSPAIKPSLKRRHDSPENSDSENIDPELIKSAIKRKRCGESSDDTLKHAKSLSYALVTKPRASNTPSTPIEAVKAPSKLMTSTVSASAPTPIGRSAVKSKRGGLSTRRTSSGSLQYTRLDTPTHGRTRAPFSLAAALNGTFSKSKRRGATTIEESMPKSWMFDIREDSEGEHIKKVEEQDDIVLSYSFSAHDISDDEGSTYDQREKENIPPGMPLATTSGRNEVIPTSRKNMMTDEPRTPLGNLNAADYYGAGCDATSSVLVSAADDAPAEKSSVGLPVTPAQYNITGAEDSFLDKASLDALIAGSAPPKTEEELSVNEEMNDGFAIGSGGSIEIWESGSAKDEAETAGERIEESIFAV